MASVEELIIKLTADNSDLKRKMADSEKSVGGFGSAASKAGLLVAGAFAVGASAAINIGRQIIQVRGAFEKYNAVLKNTLGSQAQATASMQMITDFATKTPFQVDSLTNSYVKLVNQGFIPSREQMRKLGDIAASTGKDFDQLVEGILDATTGEFERLKEFGIKTKSEGDKLVFTFKGVETQVNNNADAIREYVLSLGDLAGVSGSMSAISETLVGKLSNLGDSYDQWLNALGSRTSGLFVSIAEEFTNMLNTMTSALNAQEYMKSAGVGGQGGFFSGGLVEQEAEKLAKLQASLVGASSAELDKAIIDASQKMGYYTGEVGDDMNKLYTKFISNIQGLILNPVEKMTPALKSTASSFKAAKTELDKYIDSMEEMYKRTKYLEQFDVPVPLFGAMDSNVKSGKSRGITQGGDPSKLQVRTQKEFGAAIKNTTSELQAQIGAMTQMNSIMTGFGEAAATAFGEQSMAAKAFAAGQVIAQAAVGIMGTWAGYAEFGPVGTALAVAQTAMIGGLAVTQLGKIAGAFAQGGIVGGSSFSGDRMTARVNSGEMILNGRQQQQLFAMANGGGGSQRIEIYGTLQGDAIRLSNKRSSTIAMKRGVR